MTHLVVGDQPAPLSTTLVERLARLSFPTLGHHLEEGFADRGVVRQSGSGRVIGRAVTLRVTAQDSTLLQHAAGFARPGDVFVIDTGGDERHAPVGLVIATQLAVKGAVGIIVDGVVTDVDEVNELGIPVFARGRSMMTTKQLGLDAGSWNMPVVCGGVTVLPGDLVLADNNGVMFARPDTVEALLDLALLEDQEEPQLIVDIENGALLGREAGATDIIEAILRS
jgi:4-hydroxy-4-methyl-2-oxoglutarate aldolase